MAQDIQIYWPSRNELAVIDGVAVKRRQIIIIPSQLQMQTLNQLHSKHMGIEKRRLVVCKSIYWVNMNAYIENAVKQCLTYLEYWNICRCRKK